MSTAWPVEVSSLTGEARALALRSAGEPRGLSQELRLRVLLPSPPPAELLPPPDVAADSALATAMSFGASATATAAVLALPCCCAGASGPMRCGMLSQLLLLRRLLLLHRGLDANDGSHRADEERGRAASSGLRSSVPAPL